MSQELNSSRADCNISLIDIKSCPTRAENTSSANVDEEVLLSAFRKIRLHRQIIQRSGPLRPPWVVPRRGLKEITVLPWEAETFLFWEM